MRREVLVVTVTLVACTDRPTSLDGDGGSGSASEATSTTAGATGDTSAATSAAIATTSGDVSTAGSDGVMTTSPPDGTTDAPPHFDVGTVPDVPIMPCETPLTAGPHIWISNSSQSTLSKVHTQTLTELARYVTRPDSAGSPSRTSVSLTGNVAVANRNGGLTKFYGNPADCVDLDGNGVVETAVGPVALPWSDEECRAWHTPMVYASQRPVAWTPGTWDDTACAYVDEKVWTSGSNGSSIEVLLLDGETGVIEETIPVPGVPANFYGIYGAAVDASGNFWGSQLGTGWLVHVDRTQLVAEVWPMPVGGYGMTVDEDGYVWTCSSAVARFDPVSELWQSTPVGGSGGCMSDGNGKLWLAASPLIGIDRNTLAVTDSIVLPQYVHGVSVDFDGYIWGVTLLATEAYRIDPATGTFDTVGGFVTPYTYSDMTGFALANVAGP